MGNQKVKFKMTLKELSFEFEGDRETGQRLQSDIRKTLTQIGHTHERMLPGPDGNIIDAEATPVRENGKDGKRGYRPRRPRGNSCRAVTLDLVRAGFFSEKRDLNAIQSALAANGHTFKPNEISGVSLSLTKKKVLKRQENEGGNWEYERGDGDVDAGSGEGVE